MYTKFENFILESKRIDDLEKKYVKKLGLKKEIFDYFSQYKDILEMSLKLYTSTPEDKINKIEKYGTKFHELLINMLKVFMNNKDNIKSVNSITEIKSIDHLREILNEVKPYDYYYKKYDDDEIWVLCNSYEYFIYKPYTFESSEEYGYNKNRDNNWCSTYSHEDFRRYLGERGGLLYIINKYDVSKCFAFSFSKYITVWDYKDRNVYDTKDLISAINFISDEEPAHVLIDNLEDLENDMPDIDYDHLREVARDYYLNVKITELVDILGDSIYNYVDDEKFLDDIKESEREYYSSEWKYEDLNYYFHHFVDDNVSNNRVIFDYFIDNYNDEIRKMFELEEDEEIDDYIVKSFIDDCDTKYIKKAIIDLNLEDDFVEYLVDNKISYYHSAKDYFEEFYGSNKIDNYIINSIENYLDYEKIADDIVDSLGEEELLSFAN